MLLKLTMKRISDPEKTQEVFMEDKGLQGTALTFVSEYTVNGVVIKSVFVAAADRKRATEIGMDRFDFDCATLAEEDLDLRSLTHVGPG